MKLPVVCFDTDGLRENISDGETGFAAPKWDWQQLAQHLHYLWVNPDLRIQMGNKGRERVARLFTIENQVAGFDALYQQVLRRDHDKS